MAYNKQEIYKWFSQNYIESKEECKELLIQAEIDTPNTIEKIYESCVEIKRVDYREKRSLKAHLKYVHDMSMIGINGKIAGIRLKEVLLAYK